MGKRVECVGEWGAGGVSFGCGCRCGPHADLGSSKRCNISEVCRSRLPGGVLTVLPREPHHDLYKERIQHVHFVLFFGGDEHGFGKVTLEPCVVITA